MKLWLVLDKLQGNQRKATSSVKTEDKDSSILALRRSANVFCPEMQHYASLCFHGAHSPYT